MPFKQVPSFGSDAFHQHQEDVDENSYLMGIQKQNELRPRPKPSRRTGQYEEGNPLLFGTFQTLAMPLQQTNKTVENLVKLENNNNDTWKNLDGEVTEEECAPGNFDLYVKGANVDERILPGFKYRVRILGCNNQYLLKGQALHLLSIGQGYGKRITFESYLHNINSNYFWSDSNDNGYGFRLVAVEQGDSFTICNLQRRPIGHAVVEELDRSQIELNTAVINKEIIKEVKLKMKCRVQYTCEPHGMRSLRADETVVVNGVAVITKSQEELKAVTKLIKNIELSSIGPCLFVKER